ncbi:Alpha-L-fucosidase precursor [Pelomyxa schiedti]|nr:Alpha-L-fucosidase precursor [Pelomyxa schiedti]
MKGSFGGSRGMMNSQRHATYCSPQSHTATYGSQSDQRQLPMMGPTAPPVSGNTRGCTNPETCTTTTSNSTSTSTPTSAAATATPVADASSTSSTTTSSTDNGGVGSPTSTCGTGEGSHSRGHRRTYTADWASLDARPLPKWYADAKFGVFIHWGVYAVPAFAVHKRGGAEWYLRKLQTPSRDDGATRQHHSEMYGPNFPYSEFAPQFNASKWDPNEWASIFAAAGAKYVVLTSKHHEGFCLWGSKMHPQWNAVDVGPHRDLIKALSEAVRAKGMKFGLYYSLLEWSSDISDGKNIARPNVVASDLRELVQTYKPSVLWFDGNWGRTAEFWRTKEFLAWLYNESDVRDEVVVNDRLGEGCSGFHGDFYNGRDRFIATGTLVHKWECCMTIGSSWGHNSYLKPSYYKRRDELLRTLIEVVAKNGNLLLNVGPTSEGLIVDEETSALLDIGSWLNERGCAIFSTSPWPRAHNAGCVSYTVDERGTVYALVTSPSGGSSSTKIILRGIPRPSRIVSIPMEEITVEFSNGESVVRFTHMTQFPVVLQLQYNEAPPGPTNNNTSTTPTATPPPPMTNTS